MDGKSALSLSLDKQFCWLRLLLSMLLMRLLTHQQRADLIRCSAGWSLLPLLLCIRSCVSTTKRGLLYTMYAHEDERQQQERRSKKDNENPHLRISSAIISYLLQTHTALTKHIRHKIIIQSANYCRRIVYVQLVALVVDAESTHLASMSSIYSF